MADDTESAVGSVRIDLAPPIGWLIVDNPARRNAVNLDMWRQFAPGLEELEDHPDIRVIVLRGGGDEIFISGADISEFETTRRDAASARDYEHADGSAFAALRQATKPTIAMIRGYCLGGGVGLAVACDLRIAAHGTVFGIPAARLGIGYPPSAFRDVVKLIGPSAAKMLYFTAGRVDHDEALRIGLVDRIVQPDILESETHAIAATIGANAPKTIRAAKAAIDLLTGAPEDADWARVHALTDACFDSEDFAEGRRAFLEKRKPVFRDR